MQKTLVALFFIVLLGLAKGAKTGCWSAVKGQALNIIEALADMVEKYEEENGGVSDSSSDSDSTSDSDETDSSESDEMPESDDTSESESDESDEGSPADLIEDLAIVCHGCFNDCLWIDTVKEDMKCAAHLYNEFSDAYKIAESWGLDIFAEWDFLKNLYSTYKVCKKAVEDTVKLIDDGVQEGEKLVNEYDDNFYVSQTSTYDGLPSVIEGEIHVYHGDIEGKLLESPYLYIASDSSDELPDGFEAASLQLGESDEARQWILNAAVQYMQEISQPEQYPATRLVCTSYDGNGDTAINVNCSLEELAAGKWQCGYFSQCATDEDVLAYWFPLGHDGNCIAPATLMYADGHPNEALQLVGGCANIKKESVKTEDQNLESALDNYSF